MRLDFRKREGSGVVVDEELKQEPACRGDTLAVMAQNGKKVFVLPHGMPFARRGFGAWTSATRYATRSGF